MNQVKSLQKDEASQWWLIDSGASVTVIAKRYYIEEFHILEQGYRHSGRVLRAPKIQVLLSTSHEVPKIVPQNRNLTVAESISCKIQKARRLSCSITK